MKKQRKRLFCIMFLMVSCLLLSSAVLYAKEQNFSYAEGEQEVTMTVGDTGRFEIPETIISEGVERKVTSSKIQVTDYNDWDNWYDWDNDQMEEENDSNILSVDNEGNYTAKSVGKAWVTIILYFQKDGESSVYYDSIESYYSITVVPDMEMVRLKSDSQEKYVEKNVWGYYDVPSYTFSLESDSVFDENYGWVDVSYASSNSKIKVYGILHDNSITLYPSDKGSTTVTITICGKEYKVKIKTTVIGINKHSLLIAKGKNSKLKVSGISKGIKWSSSNKKIATVSSDGTVKAKKNGNVVIKAKIGNSSLGCAVSVVTSKRYKVVKRAIQITKTCTYSQPKRMQSKYYDCSSLVWKAYSKYEQNFGSKSYAPVAADLAKWCANRKKVVKGGVTYNNVQKMKYHPGDLFFCTGSNNGRYKGIYHVEMISGYVCYGFDSSGKPILELDYVNRSPGYGYGGMVGQP